MAEVIEGKWFDRQQEEKITFTEMMKKYMTEHSERNKAQTSHIRDKSLVEYLLKYFGDLTLAEITPKLISMVTRYAHHYSESLGSGIEVLDKLRENHITILSQFKEKGVTTNSQPLVLIGSGG